MCGRVHHELSERLADRALEPERLEPGGRRRAGGGLALADLVAVEEQHARRPAMPRQLTRDREACEARAADRPRRSRRRALCARAPRLVRRVGIVRRRLPAAAPSRPDRLPRGRAAIVRACRRSTRRLRKPQAPPPATPARPHDRGRRPAGPELRRDDRVLRGGRRRDGQGRADRQGRGPRRHRLQVRGGHPAERAVDPPLDRPGRGGRSSARRSTRSCSPRRTRTGA